MGLDTPASLAASGTLVLFTLPTIMSFTTWVAPWYRTKDTLSEAGFSVFLDPSWYSAFFPCRSTWTFFFHFFCHLAMLAPQDSGK